MKYTKLILDEKMIVPEPKIRLEFFLHAIVTGETCELKPKTVDEEYLYAIATSDTSRMGEIYPRTLVELYYDAILNNSVEDLPTPRTRWEEFLRSAVTKEPCELEPETSLEIYLSQISSNGGFDYIVSTSTNSTIISLPNSINGVIKSVEMDGNTLVNYCTNGSEELTLNNEINAQGTSVTLTDTVDNSKVDVVCEGNTLVNLATQDIRIGHPLTDRPSNTSKGSGFTSIVTCCKPNTVYTVSVEGIGENKGRLIIIAHSNGARSRYITTWTATKSIFTFSLSENEDAVSFGVVNDDSTISSETLEDILSRYKPFLLEGDYTNKPIPSYFEGMKSVGECEDNKIEILSRNKNMIDFGEYAEIVSDGIKVNYTDIMSNKIKLLQGQFKPNTQYVFKCKAKELTQQNKNPRIRFVYTDGSMANTSAMNSVDFSEIMFRSYEDKTIDYITFTASSFGGELILKDCILIESSNFPTEYIEPKQHKTEISLNEPLRGLPNGVCDKFVKQGGKWYIERNCNEIILRGSENWSLSDKEGLNTIRFVSKPIDKLGSSNIIVEGISDKFSYESNGDLDREAIQLWYSTGEVKLRILKTKASTVGELKQWLSQNPVKIIYQLATPIYEEITDPQVITYLDATHISTNSTIPCNMKVTNSGYNAIIKPSTQYTVAFDTNTSGEVNIGLGGAKTSTTNNVATITTPSTLTDDSLRLYGKGIKASNVRLLEGDKANYIPQYFEGMKSCFEDKEQGDNTYGVEISSNSKNLFDVNKVNSKFIVNNNTITGTTTGYNNSLFTGKSGIAISDTSKVLKLKAGTYILSKTGAALTISYRPINNFTTSSVSTSGSYGRFTLSEDSYVDIKVYASNKDFEVSNIQIEKGSEATDYVPYKSNKIQLQLTEPLRAVGDVKDRFVFKDSKLMVERNCYEVILNGSEKWTMNNGYSGFVGLNPYSNTNRNSICDKVLYKNTLSADTLGYNIYSNGKFLWLAIPGCDNATKLKDYLRNNPIKVVYTLQEPTYEEVPTSQKLTCYENATLFIDTNIAPTHVEIEYPTEKQQLFRIK